MNSVPDRSSARRLFRSRVAQYGSALIIAAAAVFLRKLLDPILGDSVPFATVYGAAAVAVWFGGWKPALLSALLGYAGTNYLFIPPRHSFVLTGSAVWTGLATYAISCCLIIYLGEAMRRANQRLRTQIMDRQADEKASRASEARFGAILTSAMDAIISVGEDQRIVMFNRAAENIFRCPASEAMGQPLDKFIPERFRQAHRRHLQDFSHTGVTNRSMSRPGTLWGLRSNGEEFPIEAAISQVEAHGQKLFTVILRDITERKEAEARLVEQAGLLELASDAIIVRNERSQISYWNHGAEELYGWRQEEAIGELTHDLLKTEFPQPLADITDKLDRENRWEGELVHTCRSGTRVTVLSRWALVRDASDAPCQVLEVNTDVTERKRTEEALHSAEKLVATGRLASTLAHEINNPLAAAVNLAYIFRSCPSLPQDLQAYAVMLDQELTRIGHIVRQTLSLYREGAKSTSAVRLEEIIDDVIASYRDRLNGFSVERRYDCSCLIQGNRAELHHLVSNLIGNAVEAFSNSHGSIKVHIFESRDWGDSGRTGIRIVVADSGMGMDAESCRRLLEPFFTTKQQKGTGLGLPVVQWIAAQYGGSLRIHSSTRPGRSGTCVSVFLCVETVPKMTAEPAKSKRAASQFLAS